MTTTRRAWLYVCRNKKRTILLLLLFIVLITISLLGFALNTASKNCRKRTPQQHRRILHNTNWCG